MVIIPVIIPVIIQVLQPLSAIFGKNYIKKILQDEVNVFPTNIALLLAVFKKAITYEQVTADINLKNLIQKYLRYRIYQSNDTVTYRNFVKEISIKSCLFYI